MNMYNQSQENTIMASCDWLVSGTKNCMNGYLVLALKTQTSFLPALKAA